MTEHAPIPARVETRPTVQIANDLGDPGSIDANREAAPEVESRGRWNDDPAGHFFGDAMTYRDFEAIANTPTEIRAREKRTRRWRLVQRLLNGWATASKGIV